MMPASARLMAAACLGLLLLPVAARPAAGRALEDIRARGVISLCAHPNALPFAARNGPKRGLQVKLAEEIARRLDVQLGVDWVTVGFQYRSVDCDLVMDAIVDEGALHERHLRWSVPYQRSGVALALAPGRDADGIARFEDLGRERRVGVQLASLAQTILGRKGLRTVPFGFEDEMLAAVAAGEIDAAAVTPISIGWHNLNHPERPLRIVHAYEHEPELAWDLAVGMRRSDRFLRRELDRVVAEMLADGAVARIYRSYGIEHRQPLTTKPRLIERKSRIGEETCIRVGNERDCTGTP